MYIFKLFLSLILCAVTVVINTEFRHSGLFIPQMFKNNPQKLKGAMIADK